MTSQGRRGSTWPRWLPAPRPLDGTALLAVAGLSVGSLLSLSGALIGVWLGGQAVVVLARRLVRARGGEG